MSLQTIDDDLEWLRRDTWPAVVAQDGFIVTPGDEDRWVEIESGLVVPHRHIAHHTCVDVFSGAGGFSLGMIGAGCRVLAGVDNDFIAATTYLYNLGAYPLDLRFVTPEDEAEFEKKLERYHAKPRKGKKVSEFIVSGGARNCEPLGPSYPGVGVFWFGDICKLTGQMLLESLDMKVGELDIMVGSPPCQSFSSANTKKKPDDPRTYLTFDFARLICEVRPKSIVMENVPQIATHRLPDGRGVLDEFSRILEAGNYGDYETLSRVFSEDPTRRIARRRSDKGRQKKKAKRKAPAKKTSQQIAMEF